MHKKIMNLAVDYYVYKQSTEDPIRRTHIFDNEFNVVRKYSDENKNNFYLCVNDLNSTDFEYFIKNKENQFLSYDLPFCEKLCKTSFFTGIDIHGYELTLLSVLRNACLFRLKNIKNKSGENRVCFTTKVDGKEFVLAFHEKKGKLVLYKKIILDDLPSFNNIIFITKDKNLMDFCNNINIPAYDNRVYTVKS